MKFSSKCVLLYDLEMSIHGDHFVQASTACSVSHFHWTCQLIVEIEAAFLYLCLLPSYSFLSSIAWHAFLRKIEHGLGCIPHGAISTSAPHTWISNL